LESRNENDYAEDLGEDEKIILKLLLRKYSWKMLIGFMWLLIELVLVNTVMNLRVP
jgi:hypothetical protein